MGSRRHAIVAVILAFILPGLLAGSGRCEEKAAGKVIWIQRMGSGPLGMPVDVAVDRNGVVFLLDSSSRSIGLFSPKGEFMREIQGKGAWKDPLALALGPDGGIFLADGVSGRVLELDLAGKVRKEYRVGKNSRVTGVAVYGGAVYCVDNRNDRVVVFRKRDAAPESWGKKGDRPGEFNSPFRIAIDRAGRVFITDVLNARVQWFSAFGQHLGTLKRFGAGKGKIFRPTGVSVDGMGRIWVGDSYTGLVQRFEESGNSVGVLATDGKAYLFGDPVGVASGADGVWVADQRKGRAALFRR